MHCATLIEQKTAMARCLRVLARSRYSLDRVLGGRTLTSITLDATVVPLRSRSSALIVCTPGDRKVPRPLSPKSVCRAGMRS